LFASGRYHAVFTGSPLRLVEADAALRDHAIIEQVISELKDGPLAHLPSSSFYAKGAWLVLACLAFNLTRTAGCLASTFHARARAPTIRTQDGSEPTWTDLNCAIPFVCQRPLGQGFSALSARAGDCSGPLVPKPTAEDGPWLSWPGETDPSS
jgi:hypothetical protein